jgi:topoisomerase-4 subunit A
MAKKQPKVEEIKKIVPEKIQQAALEDIMGDRYATYAKYVIQDRAIPDVRDGLKPVQRRIIFGMYNSNNTFKKAYRKSASSVGEVMGKFHPHGDSSIYEALVHMSQPWKYRVPLIDFQGNNGSIDGDNAAAHRYTEARLAEITEELTRDIEKDTVEMQLTFDDSQLEPSVLPGRFPNLLVNGTQGIAVAMATNIPPHNLSEIIQAAIFRLENPSCSLDDLLKIVKGPDFPTGGMIYRTDSIRDIYETGHGRIEIIAKSEIKNTGDIQQLIIKEIPYGVIKTKLVRDIDEIRFNKTIDGIIEVRDESDHKGLRIAIDLKKEANAEKILHYLYSKTDLKSSFSANMVAIVAGHPTTMNLITYLDAFLAHQVEVITKLSTFDLAKAKARIEIVSGLIKAISILDQVVKAIRASKDKGNALENLINQFSFSKPQAEAIVNLQLYKLTNTDITSLKQEHKFLSDQIETLEGVLKSRKKLDKIIVHDLNAIMTKYGTERLSRIIPAPKESLVVDQRDLIAKTDVMVVVTYDGYMKRSTIKSFKSSEGAFPGLKAKDRLIGFTQATTLDYLLAFTNLGNYVYVPIHELTEIKWKDEGRHINERMNMNPEEKILKAIVVADFKADASIVIMTKLGQIKRTLLSEFQAVRYSKAMQCIRLMDGDHVSDVTLTFGQSDLILATSEGKATCFNENELTPIGIRAGGVKAIQQLAPKESLVCMVAIEPEERQKIIMLTQEGLWRIFDSNYLSRTSRLGKIQFVYRSFKTEIHSLVYWQRLPKTDEDIFLTAVLSNDQTMPMKIHDLSPIPVDKYAKANIKLPKGTSIVSAYQETMQTIMKTTKTYPIKVGEKNEGEKEKKAKNISLFDEESSK